MTKCEGIYAQGAYITREDFDPVKTIKYFCKLYEIRLSDRIVKEMACDNLSGDNVKYLKEELDIKSEVSNAKELCYAVLNPAEIRDLFVETDGVTMLGNDMVIGNLFTDIEGYYEYADEDKTCEYLEGECIMLSFYLPFIWDLNQYKFPKSRSEAVRLLHDAGVKLLKEDIQWKERLGALSASIMYN